MTLLSYMGNSYPYSKSMDFSTTANNMEIKALVLKLHAASRIVFHIKPQSVQKSPII